MSQPSTHTPTQLDPQELRAWRGMLQVHAAVTRALDAQMHAEHGLSVSAYEVLMFLADTEGHRLRMADIADRVLLSRSGLTRLVDRLVVARATSCATRAPTTAAAATRSSRPPALAKLEAARRTHLAGVREYFLERLSDDDQRALGEAWDRVL